MKVLNLNQIKQWDKYTIETEPISSIKLIERAAKACVRWIEKEKNNYKEISVFCGQGNNGSDGLAIARLLSSKNKSVKVYILKTRAVGTNDFEKNLSKLIKINNRKSSLKETGFLKIFHVQTIDQIKPFASKELIIDALFGSGLNRPIKGFALKLIEYINSSGLEVISIDLPSGLFVDESSNENVSVHATHTLSFQCYKIAFLLPENSNSIGELHILDIQLHSKFYDNLLTDYEIVDEKTIKSIYKPRNRFANKSNYGHAALIAGSTGMMGAAVLAAKGCLRSGVGKLTCYIPNSGNEIMQTSIPEAMCCLSGNANYIKSMNGLSKYNVIGVGPGIGLFESHKQLLQNILTQTKKQMVIDADALTILARNKSLIKQIPRNSILCPHPKEFERLFGKTKNNIETIKLVQQQAKALHLIIILKGHFTFIATPNNKAYFNSTGNAGMATGGSGDVLTGILTSLLAQGYNEEEAAILGVYLHGLAGDIAASKFSEEGMLAGDIADHLGEAFKKIQQKNSV